ncbi:MAG TPA: ACP S-malonyltransferase [Actinocrinis sp.]|nr:ACP S-malonyltransferase [Actinocrinis sp.]
MVAWLFPGQGSQARGMGAALFDRYPDVVAAADAQLGYSLADLCLNGPDERLRDTRYAQPALYVVEVLTYLERAAREPAPDWFAGHSLGEYAALFAAGSLDFDTGLLLVQRRGELMSRANGGAMAAVLGPAAREIGSLLGEWGLDEVDVANDNAPEQVVLAGPAAAIDAVAQRLAGFDDARCVRLAVSAAFHSRAMTRAGQEFGRFLERFRLADPAVPVISNVTGLPYAPGTVAELLTAQISSPVRWTASMRHLLEAGERDIAELGPGTVLTGLWRANRRALAAVATAPVAERAAAVSGPARIAASPVTALPTAPPTSLPPPSPAIAPPTTPSAPRAFGLPHIPEPRHTVEQPVAPTPTLRAATETDGDDAAAAALGSEAFRRDYGIRYAYLAGAMYQGIASIDMVVRLSRAGLMGFFGAGGLTPAQVEESLKSLRERTGPDGRYGMNLLCTLDDPDHERAIVDLYIRHGVRYVEAAAYTQVTAPLVHYRFNGAHRDAAGRPVVVNHVVAKVSRPEVAAAFMRPPAEALLARLVAEGRLTPDEARIAAQLPISDDICVESDSGGHTDAGVALTLLPTMRRLRDEASARWGYPGRIRIGAAGGLGAPEALAAAFVLGADFVVTGSVNQCTPQAGTSDAVKNLLASIGVQDTVYAPAGDMFELGAQVQVVRKGTLFAARANKLYQVYRQFGSLDAIDPATRATLERDYFGRPLDQIWAQTAQYLAQRHPERLRRAERDPRAKAALVLRWYFRHSTEAALRGDAEQSVNFQIHCGPAMGAFNAWVKGTDLEDWRARDVDVIARRLMTAAARCLRERFGALVPEAVR